MELCEEILVATVVKDLFRKAFVKFVSVKSLKPTNSISIYSLLLLLAQTGTDSLDQIFTGANANGQLSYIYTHGGN